MPYGNHEGFIGFSDAALNLATYSGFAVIVFDFLAIIILIIRQFFRTSVSGWTSTIIMLFCFGFTLLMLGIIRKYLSEIFRESKNCPIYVIKEKK
ncbi:hypothetical protein ACFO26_05735 [Lactococcus nasutitermitis]|uniref:Uncharacterized protein n=1 Tax=Lactococcus nasutitermitis TaxID=1652957 RepID=A0ABV9JD73_9LACT|nr:hypothetical protein [Lactococcus nasutitermitis]